MIVPRVKKKPKLRLDYQLIERWIPEGARVLDLGCGDGQLLEDLMGAKNIVGRGIDVSDGEVLKCISRGVPVYHGDMMEGMSFYKDGYFDTVI
ncbi:MAG: methionine biosynthesis protein MetW, partial [Phycisphaerae bacterium]|nr:methionine biosynthesis protein MetW [Phycisphaerae bacterium]